MSRLEELRAKYGTATPDNMTRLEKMRAKYSVADDAGDILPNAYTQSSGVHQAPETFAEKKEEPAKEDTSKIVAGTGLGVGINLPSADDATRGKAAQQDEKIAATGLGAGINLPTQKQATSIAADVSKQMHEDATQELEQLKKDKRASVWDPSSRNPESENFKTSDQWAEEMKSAEDKRDAAAKNYYGFAGQDAVNKVLSTKGASSAFNAAVEAAVEAADLLDKYRNGGWNPEASTALKSAANAQGRAVELLVSYGIDKATAERAIEYQAGLVRQGKAAAKAQETAEWAKEHKGAASLLSLVSKQTGGLDYLNALASNQGHNSTKDIESYRPLASADFQNTAYAEALQAGASSEMGAVGKVIYDLGMSMADSVFRAYLLGPISGVLSGSSVASSMANDALARGGTNGQALTLGFAAGVAEMLFETYSIEKLINADSPATWMQWLKSIPVQGGVEASEEFFTEVANLLSDAAIMGQKSSFNTAVREYQKDGMSEEAAHKQAFLDNLGQVALSAAGGFISGGLMSAGKGAPSVIQNEAIQNELGRLFSQEQLTMLSVGQEFAEGSETRKMADSIAASLNEGKTDISSGQWGRLAQAMESEREQFGPKLSDGTPDPSVMQSLHPDEAIVGAEEMKAEDAKVQKTQEQIQVKVQEAVQVTEQAKLDATRQTIRQKVDESAKTVADMEQEYARMAEEAEQRAKQAETRNPATEPATGAQERTSVGKVAADTSVSQKAVSEANRGTVGGLLKYVTKVAETNSAVREKTQNATVDTLNAMFKQKGGRVQVSLQSMGKDGVNGQWTDDGNIVLNSDKLNTQGQIYYTLSHELFHEASNLKGSDTSAWTKAAAKELDSFASSLYGEDAWAKMKSEAYEAQLEAAMADGLTREQAEARLTETYMNEEYAADALRDVFTRTDALNKLVRENRSTAVKIRDWLQDRFSDLLTGNIHVDNATMRHMNDLVKKVNEALTSEQNHATDKAETTTQEVRRSVDRREENDSRGGDVSGRLREPWARSEDSGDVPGWGVRPELGRDSAQMADRGVRPAPREEVADEAKGRSARNERVESREDFLDRAKRAGKKIRIIKGAAVAYRDVPLISASKAAKQAVRTAKRLGETDAIVFSGSVEFNHNGITGYPSREASTLGKEMLAFSDSLTMPPVEAAAHEVAHKWMGTDRGKQYMDFVLSHYVPGTKFEQDLREAYKPEKVDEEKVAYLSGWMEDGFSDTKLSRLVDDPAAVRKAWEDLKAEMVGKNRRYSASSHANTNTPEFRAWFHDDSGELTNPDGTPKVFLRGDSFSGATKFPDGAENYSGGIFFSTRRDVAGNYAEMHSNLGGLGVYSEEFVPKDLKSWNEAFLWVESGALGPLVALEREGPEWEFMARKFDPDAAINGMRAFSGWQTLATYPNTPAGLAKFNAEYGELMTGNRIQNPGFMQAYLSAEKTLVVDAKGRGWHNVDGRHKSTNETATEAWEKGYDCVVIKNVVDGGTEGEFVMDEDGYEYFRQVPITVTIVKDSGQVKSVYNTGSFDRKNPDVRYSAEKAPDWDTQVNALLNGTFSELFWGDGMQSSSLYVKYEPTALLQEIGLSDLPLIITKKHAWDTLQPRWDENGKLIDSKYHGITEEQFRRLPELIENPVAVFRDDPKSDHPGGINILTDEFDVQGNPIFVTVNPDRRAYTFDGKSGPAHFVNMFGRDDYNGFVTERLANGDLLFVDKKRFDSNPRLAQNGPSLSSADGVESDAIIGEKLPTVKPGERRFSVGGKPLADPLYSQMEKVLNEYKGEKIGASSLIPYLKNHGVKQEEIKWSGIEQYLADKKSVTKDEALEWMRYNAIELEEQTLDGHRETTELADQTTGEIYESPLHMEETIRTWAELDGFNPDDVRFDYNDFLDNGWIVAYVHNPETGEDFELTTVKAEFSDKSAQWEEYITPGGDNYRELLYKMPESDYSNQAMRVHWGQADEGSGVLAHARVQDFETDDGTMLFIEEIQSDWHNAGQKSGYVTKDVESLQQELRDLRSKNVLNGEMTEAEIAREAELNKALYPRHAELNAKLDALKAQMTTNPLVASALDKIAEVKFNGNRHYAENNLLSARTSLYTDDLHAAGVELTRFERDAIREFIFKKEEWSREFGEYTMNGGREAELANRAPEAPYSKNYHEYVLKRLLRMAAENGYDSIGWTTGKMQEDRWSSEYAEGYRIEYDQDIPKFLNKYGKQWGAKVEKTHLNTGDEGRYNRHNDIAEQYRQDIAYWRREADMADNEDTYSFCLRQIEDAKEGLQRQLDRMAGPEIWTMKLTDQMREDVLYKGQPRYSAGGLNSDDAGAMMGAQEEVPINDGTGTVHRGLVGDYQGDKDRPIPDGAVRNPEGDNRRQVRYRELTEPERDRAQRILIPAVEASPEWRKAMRQFSMDDATERVYDWAIDGDPRIERMKRQIPGFSEALERVLDYKPAQTGNDADHTEAVLAHFGKTYSWNETGYLLKDGSQLDFSGKHNGATGGYRTVDHRDVGEAIGLDYGSDSYNGAMIRFMSEGNIRISPESNGINLSVAPTKEQEEKLERYISRARGEVLLDIDDAQGNTVASVSYPNGTKATRVLGDIRRYFADGTVPRVSEIERFRYSASKKTGGNTGNVNPDTGYERGSVADSFMRIWNVGAQDEALNMLEQAITRLAQIQADQAEKARSDLMNAVFRPRVTESVAERNKERIEKLIEKYGMMPQTGAAQQEVRLPKQIDDETIVAGAAQTMMAAGVTNKVIKDELVQDILSGAAGLTYHRVGDKATLETVDKEFEQKGFQKMRQEWENVFNGGEVTKLDIAKAEKLYVEACENKDVDAAMKLAAEIAAAGTRAGQTVQAMTLLRKMTPSGQAYYIQKTVDRLNKDPRQKNPITLDEKLVKALLDAKTREELDIAVDNLMQHVADQVPVTLADKWNTWRYFAMLGNPRTHIRNLFGNAIFTPARLAKDILGTGLEHLFLSEDKRTKSVSASRELRDFAAQDAEDMKGILRGGGKYNPADMIRDRRTIFGNVDQAKTPVGKAVSATLGKAVEKGRKKNSELLEVEDWIFLKAAYQRALSHYLSARGATAESLNTKEGRKLLEEARLYAVNEAQRATYRDMSKLAGWLNNAKRQNKFAEIFLDGIVPFTKTPINIVKRGLEYSPLGLAKTLYDGVAKVRKGTMEGAELIDELSANLTGTGVALLGVLLSHLGLLTGALGDEDEDKFRGLQGEQSYSIHIDGVGSYTIDWMAPVALPLFVGAEIYNTLAADYSDVEVGQILSAIGDGMASILEPMLSLSMLDGLNDALSANKYGDSEDALWSLLSSVGTGYISQAVPAIMGQISRTADPNRRTSFVKKGEGNVEGMLKRFWQNSVQGKVPVYENEKMAYIDEWGRTDTTGSVALRAFENFLSPGYINPDKGSEVDAELTRLSEALKDTSVMPNRAQKYFTVNKETYAMSQEEYQAHLIDRGQTSYRLVSDFIHDPAYEGMTDGERARVIEKIYDYASQNAKYHTTSDYQRDSWIEEMEDYTAKGGDAVDYLVMKTKSSASTTMSELAYERNDLSASEVGSLVLGDASSSQRAPSTFNDPYAKGYVYELTGEQQAKYTETFDRLFNERFPDLFYSEEYRNATAEERKKLVSDLRSEVAKDTKWEMADWLNARGVNSELK